LTLFTLVNASGERKKPQMRSHKWHRMFAE